MNKSIECFVGECKHNDNAYHHCNLVKIHIKKNNIDPKGAIDTNCGNFEGRG
ncbi:DUF1540 domain-containing protein [Oceanirhabdus sp. W0125-5]|uniref:DUF1540 domain-containing protein n=1 Tax=Oceanirhabdus sp. W0125-5 TaxID=2999116 RepID=UPI0022F33968|nr:DUF1540 domain-containing protein [Oceanirhabdus sp. W0125-5]WBW97461.1 DUF1540 domain-containing protein [Oceanirhabdus sp. W0125-5]